MGRERGYHQVPDIVEATEAPSHLDKEYPTVEIVHNELSNALSPKKNAKTSYFVDVPRGLYAGETFRVSIKGREFHVACPEIATSGSRIVVVLHTKM